MLIHIRPIEQKYFYVQSIFETSISVHSPNRAMIRSDSFHYQNINANRSYQNIDIAFLAVSCAGEKFLGLESFSAKPGKIRPGLDMVNEAALLERSREKR